MTEIEPIADDTNDRPGPAMSAVAAAPPMIDHEPAVAAAPARRGGTPFGVTLLFVLLLGGGIYYVWKNPQGADDSDALKSVAAQQDQLKADVQSQMQAAKDALAQAVGPLHDQIAALSDRVEKLEKAPPPSAPPPAAPAAAPPAEDASALGQRVDQLSAKLDALAARADSAPAQAPQPPAAPPPAPLPADTAALDAATQAATAAQTQVAALSSKLDQLEQAQKAGLTQSADAEKTALEQTAAAQKTALDALNDRLAKLEQGTGKIESEAEMAARAARIDALQAALAAGKPLGPIEDAPPALARFAKTPPPTDAALRNVFPAVAERAREVSQPQVARESFWARMLARMQQSIVVRRGDDVIVGDPAAGVLARATDAVNRDDLPGAVQALESLQGPAAEAVSDWVGKVRSLLDARAALASLATAPRATVR